LPLAAINTVLDKPLPSFMMTGALVGRYGEAVRCAGYGLGAAA